jgi:phospholipid transport system substrate-binding protein
MRMKTSLITTILACLVLFCGAAQASAEQQAKILVESVGQQAFAIIKDAVLTKQEKQAKLERILASHVDVKWIGRFVLGRFWRQASEEQRMRYLKEYEEFVLKYYTSRFADYSGSGFKVSDAHMDGDGESVIVNMVIASGENQDVSIQYRLHPADGGELRIYDVVVEGVSMITTQRSEFASVITNKGLDHLIAQLADRTIAVPKSM